MVIINKICGIKLEPGTKKIGYLKISKMADGTVLKIAAHIIVGFSSGPKLAIISTVHGDETLGIDVLKEIVTQLDISKLSGTIIIIPVANPIAFQNGTRNTPIDMLNLNRVFPGNIDGYLTEKIAYHITNEILKKVDYIINLHGGNEIIANNFGFIRPPYEELHKVFGHEIMYIEKPGTFVGSISEYAISKLKIPVMVSEIGTSPRSAEKDINDGVTGIFNIMKYIKMIEGNLKLPKKQLVIKDRVIIRAEHGGIFYPEYDTRNVGLEIEKGTKLGTIIDPQTFEKLQSITAPFEKNIIMLCRERSKIIPGEYIFTIGNIETSEKLI